MGALVTVGINALLFYFLPKIIPGFRIKDEKTALSMSVVYSILMFLGGLLVFPLVAIVNVGLAIISFIPFIGPLLASSGLLVTTFLVTFGLTAIMLIIIDKMLEDFEITSPAVTYLASFLLAIVSVFLRMVVGV
ncbi:MAG: hypothetical protein EOM80_11015 [Erysipelotrichia bacterium]|nr:phage holin family protein [Candidatus Riflebacteria bacterium]NCB39292.1 hypothetical protein [Erysipelotrichia bacterium]